MECKEAYSNLKMFTKHVLIETLWNVKIENYDRMEDWTGINRNIVECKDSFFDCPLVPLLVLIETLWNVKSVDHLQVDFSLRINRNIVECKVGIALTCLECSG